MHAHKDSLPTEGQPTQAQDAPESDAAKPSASSATTDGEAARGRVAAADAEPGAAGGADAVVGKRAAARQSDRGAAAARTRTGTRRRGDDGRYLRAYRGLDASLHEFRDELSAIADDVGYLLRNESVVNPELKAQLEQRFHQLRGTVSLLAEEAVEAGDRLRADVEDEVQARITAARDAVQQRPITSVAMAAVIGMSVGMLLSRRR